ncbi:hypothetical protein MBLNU457_5639t1 [Dothideomycetes sp. NU457]
MPPMQVPSLRCLQTLRALVVADTPTPCVPTFQRRHASTPSPSPKPPKKPQRPAPKVEYRSPATVRKEGERTVQPLSVPLGMAGPPPQAGQNTGVDTRSIRQRRDDFVNFDKHLEKRQKMKAQISRSYFRDFNEMKHHKGKAFIAPERAIRAEHALYFPNLRGRTLRDEETDTTKVLAGRVSVVTVLSSGWAENQVATWCSEKQHPELHTLLEKDGPRGVVEKAQLVEINHEPNFLKYWLLRLFSYRLKAQRLRKYWHKYFVVRKGFNEFVRESVGIVNQKVGYVYLLDPQCRIRWAGNAVAQESEKASMVKNLERLLEEDSEARSKSRRNSKAQRSIGDAEDSSEKKAEVVLGEVHGMS